MSTLLGRVVCSAGLQTEITVSLALMLKEHVETEITIAQDLASTGDLTAAFVHLERAHVLGQASTWQHTRVHWRMLKLGLRMRLPREIWGQMIRIVGAATKTPFGIYPVGNTGGSNVWFFKPMPIPEDLKEKLKADAC